MREAVCAENSRRDHVQGQGLSGRDVEGAKESGQARGCRLPSQDVRVVLSGGTYM